MNLKRATLIVIAGSFLWVIVQSIYVVSNFQMISFSRDAWDIIYKLISLSNLFTILTFMNFFITLYRRQK